MSSNCHTNHKKYVRRYTLSDLSSHWPCYISRMFRIWHVPDVGCSDCEIKGCGMFVMREAGDVECSRGGMFGVWDVGYIECLECDMIGCWMLGMGDVGDVGCSGCGVFRIWDVGCGMFARMRDADLQNAINNMPFHMNYMI